MVKKRTKKSKKYLLPLCIVVGLLIFTYIYVQFGSTIARPGWRTYSSDTLSFTFDYPKNWSVKEKSNTSDHTQNTTNNKNLNFTTGVIITNNQSAKDKVKPTITISHTANSSLQIGASICEMQSISDRCTRINNGIASGYIYYEPAKNTLSFSAKNDKTLLTVQANQSDKEMRQILQKIISSIQKQ